MDIKDSVLMITGGAIRVGRTHALHLARRGAHVSFTYLPGEPWEKTKAEIEALGVQCLATPLDVRDLEGIRRWTAATLGRLGRIDILINNASPFLYKPFLELTEAEWDLSVDVNVKAAFFCAQAVAPTMLRQKRGVIVNVTDLSVYQVWPGYAHHAVGKAGVVQLTRYLAVEIGPHVRVNAIAPGPILLPENFTPAQTQEAIERTLVKRLGSPEDAAGLVAFLIESDYLTGGVYFVDGGSALI
ncbi:MAG TPA: SDR family oxidoreductase [Anaerolineales bacterium]|nr:SDR family oxidoreductase [Anaerolineales bacterium]